MTAPRNPSPVPDDLLSRTLPSSENANPLQVSLPTSYWPLTYTTSTANLHHNLYRDRQRPPFLTTAFQFDDGVSLSAYVPLMVESAERLAITALRSWEMLSEEVENQREIFKLCCDAEGIFDSTLFLSYCNRLRLIHNSLCCGLLVALRAILDQLRVWLQIGSITPVTRNSFLPEGNGYTTKLVQLINVMQDIEQSLSTVQFPDAVALSEDTSLMGEIHAQHHGSDTPLAFDGGALGDNLKAPVPEASDLFTAVDTPDASLTCDQYLSTVTNPFGVWTNDPFMQQDYEMVQDLDPHYWDFRNIPGPVEVADGPEHQPEADSGMVEPCILTANEA